MFEQASNADRTVIVNIYPDDTMQHPYFKRFKPPLTREEMVGSVLFDAESRELPCVIEIVESHVYGAFAINEGELPPWLLRIVVGPDSHIWPLASEEDGAYLVGAAPSYAREFWDAGCSSVTPTHLAAQYGRPVPAALRGRMTLLEMELKRRGADGPYGEDF